jgi:hypothetical protein
LLQSCWLCLSLNTASKLYISIYIYIYWRRSWIITFHLRLGLPKIPLPFCFVYQYPVCNFIFLILVIYRLFYWSWSDHTSAILQYTMSSS